VKTFEFFYFYFILFLTQIKEAFTARRVKKQSFTFILAVARAQGTLS